MARFVREARVEWQDEDQSYRIVFITYENGLSRMTAIDNALLTSPESAGAARTITEHLGELGPPPYVLSRQQRGVHCQQFRRVATDRL